MLPPAQSISVLDTLRTLSWKDLREAAHPKADVQALRAVAWAPVCYLFIVLSMVLCQKASGQLRNVAWSEEAGRCSCNEGIKRDC